MSGEEIQQTSNLSTGSGQLCGKNLNTEAEQLILEDNGSKVAADENVGEEEKPDDNEDKSEIQVEEPHDEDTVNADQKEQQEMETKAENPVDKEESCAKEEEEEQENSDVEETEPATNANSTEQSRAKEEEEEQENSDVEETEPATDANPIEDLPVIEEERSEEPVKLHVEGTGPVADIILIEEEEDQATEEEIPAQNEDEEFESSEESGRPRFNDDDSSSIINSSDDEFVKEIFKNRVQCSRHNPSGTVKRVQKLPKVKTLTIKQTAGLKSFWERNAQCDKNRKKNQQPVEDDEKYEKPDWKKEDQMKSLERKRKKEEKFELPVPKKNPENYQSSYDTPMTDNMTRLFDASFRHSSARRNWKTEPEPEPIPSLVCTSSHSRAEERNRRIIEAAVGTNNEVTESKLKLILTKFHVTGSEKFGRVKEETGLVGKNIKKLLISAANGTGKGLAAEIRLAVTGAITNMRFAAMSPRRKQ